MSYHGKVLVVDDDPLVLQGVERIVLNAGFEVVAVGSGAMALREISKQSFSAIVTDIDLVDRCDGWEIGKAARDRHADVSVVYMSGGGNHANWTVMGVPGSTYLQKPFELGDLPSVLYRHSH